MASLGAAPTTEQMEASSARRMRSTFASDAAEELPPAPRLARRERRSLRDTDRHAEREEERGDQDEDRAAPQQLAETGAAHHPKHKQYSLAPESRDSHYETAYDFASQLERHQEDRAAHASGGPHIERPAHADRAEARADAMGIPNGRNEGNTITAYKHVAPRTRGQRERRARPLVLGAVIGRGGSGSLCRGRELAGGPGRRGRGRAATDGGGRGNKPLPGAE